MRKSILFAIASLAILSVACVKETAPEEKKPSDNPNVVVFTAPAPKTTIDANDKVVSWEEGDEVKFVWDGGSDTATAVTIDAATTFTVEVPSSITELYAVYPASAAANDSYDDGKVNVTFPSSITDGSFAANDICVAKAVKDGSWDTTLAFKNVACLMKVGVTSSDITSLQIFSGVSDDGEYITGSIPLSIDGDNVIYDSENISGAQRYITVTATGSGARNYYIPVLPGTLNKGFRVKLFEGQKELTPFYYNGEYSLERGKIIKINEVESHAGHYYVTPSGSKGKTGQNWNHAMDAATFKAFIEKNDNYFILKGATIHLSAEAFTFGDYLQPDFSGHGETTFTIEGTRSGDNITTFIGGSGQPAGTLWPKTSCNLTVKNVKFTGTHGSGNRAAIRVNTGSAKLTLKNCVFDGNYTEGNGGAIAVYNAAQLDLIDCNFYRNHANGGACFFVNTSRNITINVTGGTFEGNYAVGTGDTNSAGAIFYAVNNGGTPSFNFSGVTFKENYCLVGENENIGGILRIYYDTVKGGEAGQAYFNNCVFEGNYTNRSTSKPNPCAAIVSSLIDNDGIRYYFNACEFKENTSGTSNSGEVYGGLNGTVFATENATTFAFNNCSIHDNYGGRNSDHIVWIGMNHEESTLILANTTVIGDNYRFPGFEPATRNNWGVIKFLTTGNYYLLNSILCSPDIAGTKGNCFWVADGIEVDGQICTNGSNRFPVTCYYSKTSKEGDYRTNWGTDTGSGHDYYATSASFGGWSAPYTWNGTLYGTNNDQLATTANVNTQIYNADSSFHAWLTTIEALGKDIEGHDRGATSWPGCYQDKKNN